MAAINAVSSSASNVASNEDAARHRKLVDAAQQFEAMFLQQLLKSTGVDGQDASSQDDASSGSDTYKSFGTEAVAKAVSAAGGLGIARQVVRQVERASSAAGKDDTRLKSFSLTPIGVSRRPE